MCSCVGSKVPLVNQIVEFLKQLKKGFKEQHHLKKDEVNQSDILHVGRDTGKLILSQRM